jgi:tRNA modification GTPase
VTADTIAAISTPLGEGGIGIVRVSGPDALAITSQLTGREMTGWPTHTVRLVRILTIDTALVTVFHAPNSYTGEDVVEFSCHGGPAVVRAVLDACLVAGARPAEPGEFTRRAFINGRMDLTQAEAVAALIQSHTRAAVSAAHGQLTGALADQISQMRRSLIELSARLEAEIDFPDDIEEMGYDELDAPLRTLEEQIAALLQTARRGIALRTGLRAAIVGKPNVGKSTLMNLLLGRDRVIVSAIPGATRDVVEEEIEIAGVPIRLADTAGLGLARDELDRAGTERALRQIGASDLVIAMLDASTPFDDQDRALADLVRGRTAVAVVNKVDLPRVLDGAALTEALSGGGGAPQVIETCLLQGQGIEELESAIADLVCGGQGGETEGVMICEARHADALRRTAEHIAGARRGEGRREGRDLVSDDLRAAADALGEITGETALPALIDAIFSRFCVGK